MRAITFMSGIEHNKKNIEMAIDGDEKAFVLLIEENLTAFYRVAKGILHSEEDIKDSIQNTIFIIYKKIHTLKNIEFFRTWAIRILINECNKVYKNNKKITSFEGYINDTSYISEIDSKIDLYDAIETLPKELKIPTILFYFNDLSYREISEIIDIPEGTVKSRVFRAKEKLYKILKG